MDLVCESSMEDSSFSNQMDSLEEKDEETDTNGPSSPLRKVYGLQVGRVDCDTKKSHSSNLVRNFKNLIFI